MLFNMESKKFGPLDLFRRNFLQTARPSFSSTFEI